MTHRNEYGRLDGHFSATRRGFRLALQEDVGSDRWLYVRVQFWPLRVRVAIVETGAAGFAKLGRAIGFVFSAVNLLSPAIRETIASMREFQESLAKISKAARL